MKRRTLLRTLGGAGAAGTATLSGCLGAVDDTLGGSETTPKWRYDRGGKVDAVVDGTLFGRTRYDDRSEPNTQHEVVALDADTGDLRWKHGPMSGMYHFPDLAVGNGVYFSVCADDDCQKLYAYDTDGEQRWTRDRINARNATAVEDALYYSNGLYVRALDAATGETRWEREREGAELATVADGTVYVGADDSVLALDRTGGTTRWRYETGDARDAVRATLLADGVTYVVSAEGVAAVSEGEELWRTAFEEVNAGFETTIAGIAAGHLFVLAERDVADAFQLRAFDVAAGERVWTTDAIESGAEWDPTAAVGSDVAYVGDEKLRALDAETGEERWRAGVDDERVRSVTVVEEGVADDHAVFVSTDEGRLARFTPDGRQTWDASVDGDIWNYLVDESVFVATDEGFYALDRPDNS